MSVEGLSLCVIRTTDLAEGMLAELRIFLENVFRSDFDTSAWTNCCGGTHVLLRLEKRIVAHASLVERLAKINEAPCGVMYVEAVAVATNYQNKQLGHCVMGVVNFLLYESKLTGFLATSSVPFYERLHWKLWTGPSFVFHSEGVQVEAKPRGRIMYLPSADAYIDPSCPIAISYRDGDIW